MSWLAASPVPSSKADPPVVSLAQSPTLAPGNSQQAAFTLPLHFPSWGLSSAKTQWSQNHFLGRSHLGPAQAQCRLTCEQDLGTWSRPYFSGPQACGSPLWAVDMRTLVPWVWGLTPDLGRLSTLRSRGAHFPICPGCLFPHCITLTPLLASSGHGGAE